MLDTFIDGDVILALEPGAEPDFAAIEEQLKDAEIEFEGVETSNEQPF